MANCQDYKTHPTGHNTSEVDWGGHDPNPNHLHESLLSEVDWGAHHPSVNSSSKDYGENHNTGHPIFLSLGPNLILWLLDNPFSPW